MMILFRSILICIWCTLAVATECWSQDSLSLGSGPELDVKVIYKLDTEQDAFVERKIYNRSDRLAVITVLDGIRPIVSLPYGGITTLFVQNISVASLGANIPYVVIPPGGALRKKFELSEELYYGLGLNSKDSIPTELRVEIGYMFKETDFDRDLENKAVGSFYWQQECEILEYQSW